MSVLDDLHWSVLQINFIMLYIGCVATSVQLVLIYKTPTMKMLYYVGIGCFIFGSVTFAVFLYFRLNGTHILWFAIFLLALIPFLELFNVTTEELYLKNILALMVPSEIQAFAESIRMGFGRIGAVLGMFTGAFNFHHMYYFVPASVAISAVLVIIMILRKEQFQNPKLIF